MIIKDDFFEGYNVSSEIIKLLSFENHEIIIDNELIDGFFNWFNNIIIEYMSPKQCMEYVVYVSELVLPIFEKEHPDDNDPRKCIEFTKRWIEDPSEKNRKVAASAAYNFSSAYTARSAAYSAWIVYYADSFDISRSAASANTAVKSASTSVTWYSKLCDREIENKIMKYSLKFFNSL